MTFLQLICTYKLSKTPFGGLICANINEHIYCYDYYLVSSI